MARPTKQLLGTFPAALVGIVFLFGCSGRAADSPPAQVDKPKEEAAKLQKEELEAALQAKFKPLPSGWARFEVDDLRLDKHGRVGVSIVYSRQPKGYPEVQADTTKVVRAILGWIQAKGIDPVKQDLTVSTSAVLPEKGETGKKLVRFMGKSRYLGITDQIEFKKTLF